MSKFRAFLRGPGGKIVAAIAIAVGLFVLYLNTRTLLGESEIASTSRDRIFVDAESGKTFEHRLQAGDTYPIESPFTHKKTGYPAELCYWTKDGKRKHDPTPVLLNQSKGKKGPTFCPDCGRLVVPMNPIGLNPPPTEEEYKKNRKSDAEDRVEDSE
ncbi:MAG TPA: hypothetical protein VL282_08020 [Tepidisphaeraceae bacterium]|jgi:hypothetical protein|nr:hypothetical protein [Tepidisphaeraceae bacterium]